MTGKTTRPSVHASVDDANVVAETDELDNARSTSIVCTTTCGNPTATPFIAMGRNVNGSEITWSPVSGVTAYDLVEGDLLTLIASEGNFATATGACTANDVSDLSWTLGGDPAPGQGRWYLVRAADCASGTYGGSGESADRDGGIASSGAGCP